MGIILLNISYFVDIKETFIKNDFTIMITEKNLIYLGFEKQEVTIEESGDYPYYYYTLEIGLDYEPFCLITNEINDNERIMIPRYIRTGAK